MAGRANKNDAIHVAFTVDEGLLMQAVVAAHGMAARAAADERHVVHFVVPSEAAGKAQEAAQLLEQAHASLSCEVCTVPPELFARFEQAAATNHLPASSYSRLALCEMLPQVDRVIYLDADVCVLGSLAELWSTDLAGNYLAGVTDIFCGMVGDFRAQHEQAIGFAYERDYVGSGVLLMDLAAMRRDGLAERFMRELGRDYPFGDQDIFNVVCRGRIRLVPLRYYVPEHELRSGLLATRTCFPEHELAEVLQGGACVLHYIGREAKPWDYLQMRWAERWREDARAILPPEMLAAVEEQARAYARSLSYTGLLEQCRAAQSVWVYGFTQVARGLADRLAASGTCRVQGFFDQDPAKQGRGHKGAVCHDPAQISELVGPDDLLVIATQQNYGPVRKELRRRGLEPAHVARYQRKDAAYYRELLPEAYAYELDELRRALALDARPERAELGTLAREELAAELCSGRYPALEEEFCLREWLLGSQGGEAPWTSMS